MNNFKGNSSKLNPNILIFISCNAAKAKCLRVWFLGGFFPQLSYSKRLALLQMEYPHL